MVYFELDLTDPRTISALTSCQLLPQGENLQDVLPRDIYRRLKRHLEYVKLMMPSWMTPDQRGRGLYADYLFNAIAGNWERKRPVWVMLMVNSLTEADIKTRGVPVLDLYLAQEAERMRKRTGAVEKVEEQCHPLNRLNFSQVSLTPRPLLDHLLRVQRGRSELSESSPCWEGAAQLRNSGSEVLTKGCRTSWAPGGWSHGSDPGCPTGCPTSSCRSWTKKVLLRLLLAFPPAGSSNVAPVGEDEHPGRSGGETRATSCS